MAPPSSAPAEAATGMEQNHQGDSLRAARARSIRQQQKPTEQVSIVASQASVSPTVLTVQYPGGDRFQQGRSGPFDARR